MITPIPGPSSEITGIKSEPQKQNRPRKTVSEPYYLLLIVLLLLIMFANRILSCEL